ncbi:hypothetical protein R1sor_022213 [Riccia sorocarpa]|uniref:Uncharacterized protein n=1 Tax=Riccia sorocarpa TaxID=122646 RepID=A0ABD3GL55_9MARC
MTESSSPFAVAMAESLMTTLKETKAWLEKKCGGGGCRVERLGLLDSGLDKQRPIWDDDTGELEATAWEVTRCFTGMPLDEFVAREMRDEEGEILERCIGRMWILRVSRAENPREVYARIEYAEVVSRKVLFRGSSPCRERTIAESLPSSPVSTVSEFGDGSSPISTGTSTCKLESRGDSSRGAVDVTRK